MNVKTLRKFLWVLVAIFSVIAGYGFYAKVTGKAPLEIASAKIGGAFDLIRHDGTQISEKALEGRPHAIFFGFTFCPEVCPTTLVEASGWLAELGDKAGAIDFYFFSVDPERDTPEVLARYMSAFDQRMIGVTGKPEAIADVIQKYRIYSKKVPLEDDDYTMDHSAQVMLFGKDGRFHSTISFGENSETAIAKLGKLID